MAFEMASKTCFCYFGHFYVKIICKIIIYAVIGAHGCLLEVFIALMSNYKFKMASKMAKVKEKLKKNTNFKASHHNFALLKVCYLIIKEKMIVIYF